MASPLKYLRPVAGPHAIQEVVFNVFIAKDTPIEEPASFESLHSGRLKTEFPRFQRIETSVATMNLDAKETQLSSPVCVGFTFEKYRENGELIQRLRGETRPDQTMVFVNLLEYSSWAKVSEKSLRWLRKVANHQKNIMFDGVGLHYIDHLHWDADSPMPLDRILTPQSRYIPPQLQTSLGPSFRYSFHELLGADRLVTQLEIIHQTERRTGNQRLSISMPLSLRFTEPKSLKKALGASGELASFFNTLHDHNKKILKDLLARSVTKKIGL